jgi:hypothetical protein
MKLPSPVDTSGKSCAVQPDSLESRSFLPQRTPGLTNVHVPGNSSTLAGNSLADGSSGAFFVVTHGQRWVYAV